ncbi:MAG: ABC transporter ATP-binding protein [Thaumarchaeota archaeon]|nr:ABC transporter ATP-binding protein [Nitrososphaerota archaeon]
MTKQISRTNDSRERPIDRSLIELREISKRFLNRDVVKGLSFNIKRGELFVILGPSGSGKTTTLRLLAGLERPDAGEIFINDQMIAGRNFFIQPEARNVGMVFQEYALFPNLTVKDNIAFGLHKLEKIERQRIIERMLELVGLQDHINRYPHELSGGEQQRVAFARALAPSPVVILLDEPFSNVDADMRLRIRRDMQRILRKSNITAILVTHNQEDAFAIADRIAVMNKGQIEQIATPSEMYHSPATRFVADFVGEADFINGAVENNLIRTAVGDFPTAGFDSGTSVQVMIRPSDISFKADKEGDGVVTDLEFKGSETLYFLRLSSGEFVHSIQNSESLIEIGTKVKIEVRPAQVLAFPIEVPDPHSQQSRPRVIE